MKRFLAILLSAMLLLMPVSDALAVVRLPGELQAIEAEAFAGDKSLSGVLTLPDTVKDIGDRAFADTDLFALRMPADVQRIGSDIVSGADVLYVEIPSESVSIAADALAGTKYVISPPGSVLGAVSQDINWLDIDMVFTSGGFVYHYTDTYRNAAVLLFPSQPGLSGEYTVPASVNGAQVVALDSCAFWGLDGLTKVFVHEDVGMPEATYGWADELEIVLTNDEIAPVLPDDDREKMQFFFDHDEVVLHPGDVFWLSLGDSFDGEWSAHSSDDAVATLSTDCRVDAHGIGDASVTLWIENEAIVYYATATVHVVEPDVSITQDFTEVTLREGEVTSPNWDVSSSSYNPSFEYVFETSDDSVITHDTFGIITGVGAGEATATLRILSGGEELISASVDVTVVSSELTLSHAMLWAYDGFEYQLALESELPEGAAVAWSSTNEEILVDEDGTVVIACTEGSEGGNGTVDCTVTYSDGSTATASCYINYGIYDVSFDGFDGPFCMNVGDVAERPISAWVTTFPVDQEKIEVTLTSSDPSVVQTDGVRTMTAVGAGTATLTLTIRFMDREDSATYEVEVDHAVLRFYPEILDINLSVESGEQDIHFGYESNAPLHRLSVVSSDTGVVKAYMTGDRLRFVPVSAGEATVTVTMGIYGDEVSETVNVSVYGYIFSLSQSEATLAVGESIRLFPVLEDGLEMDYNGYSSYWSSNDEIVSVDGNGYVSALSAGSAMIYFDAYINDAYSRAYCEITVTDDAAALTLNHTALAMAQGEQVQLKAYLHGTEVAGSWSVQDSGLYVSPDGLLTLRHDWPEDYSTYVVCTVEADGQTYTASCRVSGRAADALLQCPGMFLMEEGDYENVWANFSTTNPDESYTIRRTSSDESIAYFPYGGSDPTLEAVGEGECIITVDLLNSAGETVATRTCVVRVGLGAPELERLEFARDAYYITTFEDNRTATYLDPILEPTTAWNMADVTITSSDESVAVVDGHEVYAVSPGTATLTLTHEAYPGVSDTATVYVFDPEFTISAETVQSGETVTFAVTGMPEGCAPSISWETDAAYMTYVDGGWDSLTVRTRSQTDEVNVDVRVTLPDLEFWYKFVFSITGESMLLNMSDLIIEPGKGESLWSDFSSWNQVWSSTDENVATVDDGGYVTAVAYGECDIVLECETDNGPCTVSCHVTVEEGEWKLNDLNLPPFMVVGDAYSFDMDIYATRYAWPAEFLWSLDDESLVRMTEDGRYLALKPGVLTVTVTAIEGEQVESVSKAVRIVEPAVRFAQTQMDIRPGIPFEPAFITASGKEIESIVWSISDEQLLSIGEDNVVTALAESGICTVTAKVTLNDGTTHNLSATYRIIPDEEIYFNAWLNDSFVHLRVTETCDVSLFFDTNAWEEDIDITWTCGNDNIVIEECYGYAGSDVRVRAVANGGTSTLYCTVTVGGDTQEFEIDLEIESAALSIDIEHAEMGLPIGDTNECMAWYESNLPIDVLYVSSSDPDVVRVSMIHNRIIMTAVGEGNAVITATVGARGFSRYDTMSVTVDGSSFSLNKSEAAMMVNAILQLDPVLSADQYLEPDSISFNSSDPTIAYVNGNGQVTALRPGVARIRMSAIINGMPAIADCIVTVTDSTCPLTLNASCIRLATSETYQLKALWNGSEISDVVWSADTSAVTISRTGLVTMQHTWTETHLGYITATVERDGVTYTASCMLTGRYPEVTVQCESAIFLNVYDYYWFNPYFSTTVDYGELSVRCVSSNESILEVKGEQELYARAAGSCDVTLQLVTDDDVVVYENRIPVYIASDLPALEYIDFGADTYYLSLTNNNSAHLDPHAVPTLYREYGEVVMTSSDESVAIIQDDQVFAVGEGTATISIYNTLAPDQPGTAVVHVYDWQVSPDHVETGLNELVTLTVTGLEDMPVRHLRWNYDNWMLKHVTETANSITFRTMHPGEVYIEAVVELPDQALNAYTQIIITGMYDDFLPLNMTDAYVEPGHEFDLWPEFGADDHEWVSSNEDVATVDESGHVRVTGEGECVITLNCTTENGAYSASCALHVAWGEWTLKELHLDDVLVVGDTYNAGFGIDTTYGAWPDTIELTADSDLVTIEDHQVTAVKPGTVVITATAARGDEVQTVTKTVKVVEPVVRLNTSSLELRAGYSAPLTVTPATGREISSIQWSSSDMALLTVSDSGVLSAAADEGQYGDSGLFDVTASITLTDGTTHSLTCSVQVIRDCDVGLSMEMDSYREMNILCEEMLELQLDTNAEDDEVTIEWSSSSDSVTVTPVDDRNTRVKLAVCGPESTHITCTVRIGSLIEDSRTCYIYVPSYSFDLSFQNDLYELHLERVDEDAWLNVNADNVGYDAITVVSSDPGVVRAHVVNDRVKMIPVSEGSATLTVTMTRSFLSASDTLEVLVTGRPMELSCSSLELTVGESRVVVPVLGEGEVMNRHARYYWSSNDSVAVVNGDGVIHAVSTGTAVITLDTEIDFDPDDGEENYTYARAQCTVTVTDPQNPLTLSDTSIALEWNATHQLKALWNGTEITDVVWSSSSDSQVSVSATGMVFMLGEYTEHHRSYITATVERDGETYTATCMVCGKMTAERIEAPRAMNLNVGDFGHLPIVLSGGADTDGCTLTVTSDNEAIARIAEDGHTVEALASGTAAITIVAKNQSGEIVATHTCMVYVETELPELERISFNRDVYFITVAATDEDSSDCAIHTGPYVVPSSVWDFGNLEITAEDPSVVEVDGHVIRGLKPGSTTITLSHPMYPGQTDTATVYVFDLNPTMDHESIRVGELMTLSVSLDDIPEEYIQSAYWWNGEYEVRFAGGGWNTWLLRGHNAGWAYTEFHLDLPDAHFSRVFSFEVEGSEYLLNNSDYFLEPDNEFYLHPEFDCEDPVWSSSNDEIATVDEFGTVRTVAYGECDVTLNCTVDGEPVTAVCHVSVIDAEWHISDIEISHIICLGDFHSPNIVYFSYGGAFPDSIEWSTSDSSILVYNEEDDSFEPLKPGTVDIILTATEGEQVETFTKTVYVVEPAVRLISTYPNLRPGAGEYLDLLVASGRSVKSAVWSTADADTLTVAEDGFFSMSMDAEPGSSTPFTVVVTLDDDSVHTLSGWYYCLQPHELEFGIWPNEDAVYLELGSTGGASVSMWTNAAEHETSLTWICPDPQIVQLGEQNERINYAIDLTPVSEGETSLYCILEIGEGEYYQSHMVEIPLVVTAP
ncbi:MAG: hypothetical protein E7327_04530 [Clostridiales bacterium]|nr:hypothetical protein [Clostridiales bacterium]